MENCKGNLNSYCYVCGHFRVSTQLRSEGCSSDEFKSLYATYFDRPVITDKWYVPKSLCKMCYNSLFEWKRSNGKKQMNCGVPMVWSEPKAKKHDPLDCYACVNFVHGANKKKMRNYVYKSVESAQLPIAHGVANIPFKYPTPAGSEAASSSSEDSSDSDDDDPLYEPIPPECVGPQKINQQEWDFLITKIKLTQEKSDFLAAFFKKNRLLTPEVVNGPIEEANRRARALQPPPAKRGRK